MDETTKTLEVTLPAEHWQLLVDEAKRDDVVLEHSIAAILLRHVWSLKR